MEQLRDREKVAGLLRQALETYGEELLDDNHKVNALLMDYIPQYDRERKLLVRALELGIGGELLRVRDKSREEKRIVMNQCRAELESEMMLVRSAAEYLVIVIIEALCDKPMSPPKTDKNVSDTEQQPADETDTESSGAPQQSNLQSEESEEKTSAGIAALIAIIVAFLLLYMIGFVTM